MGAFPEEGVWRAKRARSLAPWAGGAKPVTERVWLAGTNPRPDGGNTPSFYPYRNFNAGSSLMSMTVMKRSWAMSSMISGVIRLRSSCVLW